MHKPYTRVCRIIVRIVLEVIGKGIDERTRVIPMPWVNDQPSRLIHHEQVWVFINNLQWDILGNDFEGVLRAS